MLSCNQKVQNSSAEDGETLVARVSPLTREGLGCVLVITEYNIIVRYNYFRIIRIPLLLSSFVSTISLPLYTPPPFSVPVPSSLPTGLRSRPVVRPSPLYLKHAFVHPIAIPPLLNTHAHTQLCSDTYTCAGAVESYESYIYIYICIYIYIYNNIKL